ncbi:G-protein-coupled receptor family 3 protein 12 [Mitosporidium daphniae]|uniref:G-protein-coupled receptor family 3 protein 12 n=1 Tax=Mitosporidium daphniae TaxID=1485682 RepID=A0A098VSP5_9MICR|nr:G-protein-coupled receptor family 3 protein 12 [Mitosporidium daphniae]KGG52113.1 G-protein-coupled receptor family 3 protein 12 [Mitosporidium daphniae]|eukprot:XP_013238540.1 G-protein-coupled receptor family 3 protein 12 [Mitosporidium daphniae]
MATNSYGDSSYFSKPAIFNAKKDKIFKIGEGIQETIAFVCGVNYINRNISIIPNLTLIYEDIDPIFSDTGAITSCISYILKKDVTLVLVFLQNYKIGYIDFTSPSSATTSPNYIRFNPDGFDVANSVVQLLKAMNWTLVSALYGDYLYGNEVKGIFSKLAASNDIRVVCSQILPLDFRPSDYNSSRPIIKRIAECLLAIPADVKIIILFTSTSTTVTVFELFYEYPPLRDVTFVLASTSFVNVFRSISISPKIAETKFIEACYETLSKEPSYSKLLSTYFELAFRCIYTGLQGSSDTKGITICLDAPPSRVFPAQCACIGNETFFETPASAVSSLILDSIYAIALALDGMIRDCDSGIETSFDCSAITGVNILDEIRKLTIERALGSISIPNNSPVNPSISYLQFVGLPEETQIGLYKDGIATINYSALNFRGGKAIPVSAIIPEVITLDYVGGIVITSISIFFIIISLIFIGLICYYREKPPIKKSSPLFCILILIGVILCLGGNIFRSIQSTRFTCIMMLWFFLLGFGLILGNILAKTYRIFKIFSNARLSTPVIQDRDLLVFSGTLILVLSIFLLIITFSSENISRIITSKTDSLISFRVCSAKDNTLVTVCLALSFVCMGILLISLGVIAYLTRNVDSAFNESIYIAITIYTYMALLIISLPLYAVSGDYKYSERARYFELTISNLVAMLVTLCALFLPKFYIIYKDIELAKLNNTRTAIIDQMNASFDSLITDVESDSESNNGREWEEYDSLFITRSLWMDQDL